MAYKNPLLEKKYWHLLTFQAAGVGLPQVISIYTPSKKKLITLPEIRLARETGKIPQAAILTVHSCLGYGSQSEFTGEEPVPEASKVSSIYMKAIEDVLVAQDPENLVCPVVAENHGEYAVQEWHAGNAAGLRLRNITNPQPAEEV